MSRTLKLAPSILSADFARLGEQVAAVARFSDRIHVDVMDGHFVPNLTMGPLVVSALKRTTDLPLEVHLMVERPSEFLRSFAEAGASRLIIHPEAADDVADTLDEIRSLNVRAALAINPETPWVSAQEFLPRVDVVTVMTVNPGFGGQAFMEDVLPKVTEGRNAIDESGLIVELEVDGGITLGTAPRAASCGADVFVAGNAIFSATDPAAAARALLGALRT